jgi:hypothetical protein
MKSTVRADRPLRTLYCVTLLHGNQLGARTHFFTMWEAESFARRRVEDYNDDKFYTGFRIDVVTETADRCVPALPYENES